MYPHPQKGGGGLEERQGFVYVYSEKTHPQMT